LDGICIFTLGALTESSDNDVVVVQ